MQSITAATSAYSYKSFLNTPYSSRSLGEVVLYGFTQCFVIGGDIINDYSDRNAIQKALVELFAVVA